VPETTVEIGRFTGLILNDDVQGRLDENELDGDILFTEIPQGLVSVSTSRGRNRDIGRTSAGTMSVSLRNQDRFFDPFIGVFGLQNIGPQFTYRPFVRPQLPLRAKVDGDPIWTGFVDDWNYDYDPSGVSVASISGTDFFGQFVRRFNSGASAPQETSGERLERVLDQVSLNFLGSRDIDTGNSVLAAGSLDDNALSYMIDIVEQSEFGLVFMGKDGSFVFRERLINPVSTAVVFTDAAAKGNVPLPKRFQGIPYEGLQIEFGSEELVNQVTLSNGSDSVTVTNDTSRVQYGLRELSVDTEVATEAGLTALANFILLKYSQPDYRFKSLTTNLRALSDDDLEDVLGLEIGDQVDVRFTPNGIGPQIALRNRIIGVSHDIGLDQHFVTFNFENLPFAFFELDSATLGILNSNNSVLAF
jgi:hypothetical protein